MAQFQQDMFIVHCGAQTPIGETAVYSAENYIADIHRLVCYEEFEGGDLEPLKMGVARYLDLNLDILNRFSEMASEALKETISILSEKRLSEEEIPVYVGLPEKYPGVPDHLAEQLEQKLKNIGVKAGRSFNFKFFSHGHSSAAFALDALQQDFQDKPFSFAILGGVDSYVDHERIDWLEENNFLKCTKHCGFPPGEAAGFCLLASEDTVREYDLMPLARIISWGKAKEENDFISGQSCLGNGLSQAVLETIPEDEPEFQIDQVYSTVAGHPYYSNEFGYSSVKVGKYIKHPDKIKLCFHHWGDIGAASIPVYLSISTYPGIQEEALGENNIIITSSLGKDRAALQFQLLNNV